MCGVDPISLAVMAAGSAISAKADSDARRDQERAVAAAERRRQERQRQLAQVVDRLVGEFEPEKRAERKQAGATQVQESIDDSVNVSRDATPSGARFEGKTSEDFLQVAGERKAEELDRTTRIARLLGQIGGAGRGREAEGYMMGDAQTDMGQLANFAGGDAYTDSLRIRNAGRPNPFMKLIGGAAQGAGVGMAASGGAGGVGGAAGGAAPAAAVGAAGPVAKYAARPVGIVRGNPLR